MKKILINNNPWQTRVAVLRDNQLQDIYFHSHNRLELERCFFKGTVAKVLPGIQTAFVDIGQDKAGFLHITEVDRALAAQRTADHLGVHSRIDQEEIERTIKKEMDIGKIFKETEEILIQVSKEPVYGKGAKLTTCFTLPGRLIVLMPNVPQIGISKKIDDRNERLRLKSALIRNLPKGMGAVIRTTAEGREEWEIRKDMAFLISQWKAIKKNFRKVSSGEKVHEDLPLTLRVVRDHLDKDVEVILTDSEHDQKLIYNFIKRRTPEHAFKAKLYEGPPALFQQFDIDKQIDAALQQKVSLRSGGSLIIETTEAMTVVDVNTGRYTGRSNLEETILKTNLEAAEEIVTQLRLRNIGGLIVIDFIDMANPANRMKLSRFLEKTLRERDKFQTVALKVSEFGLVQMTRKRSGKTLVQQLMRPCTGCNSYGYVKSIPTISYDILQNLKSVLIREGVGESATLIVSDQVFDYIVHNEYSSLLVLEKELKCKLTVESNEEFDMAHYKIERGHTEPTTKG